MTKPSRFVQILVGAAACGAAGYWLLRAPASPETPVTPARGGALTASFRSEPASYNPHAASDAASLLFGRLTQATLVRVDRETGEIEPRLAERWSSDADGRTYTLTLRSGVTFSDGTPFTSADVLFAFEALYDEPTDSVLRSQFLIDGQPLTVSAPDERTVIIRFPTAFAPGLRLLDDLPVAPRHKLEHALRAGTLREAWSTSTSPAALSGLGPFVLVEHVPGQRLVFERNPQFWLTDRAGATLPYLDRLTIQIVSEENAETLQFEAGQLDLTTGEVRPEDLAAFRTAADVGRMQLIDVGVGLDPNVLWFDLRPDTKARDPRRDWLQSEALRKAIAHAVDREAFINTVYLGAAVPVYGPVTPGNRMWFSDALPGYPHDVARAQALLAEAGLDDRDGDGRLEDGRRAPARFSILTQRGHDARERGAAVIQAQLATLGLAVDVVTLDPPSLFARYMAGDFDAIYFGVDSSDTDPWAFIQFWRSDGLFHFWHPLQKSPATEWEARIDDLMRQQVSTLDQAERRRLFLEAQRLLHEHAPALFFAAPRLYVAASSRVSNMTPALTRPHVLWNPEVLAVRHAGTH